MEARNEIVSLTKREVVIGTLWLLVWVGLTIFGIILGKEYNCYFILSYMTFCWMLMISEITEKEAFNVRPLKYLINKKPYIKKMILRLLLVLTGAISIFHVGGFFSFAVVCWLYLELKKTLKKRNQVTNLAT